MGDLSFVWLELTGKCQLRCAHCSAESGPSGTHGTMSTGDWLRVIDQAAGLGVTAVQFMGGEPTVHPDLAMLVLHALARVARVEVFSNLVHIPPDLWKLFSVPGVSLATSHYSDNPAQHEAITGRRGSHAKTRANIVEAIRRGISLRVAVIDLEHNQRWRQAVAELEALGVTAIGCDRLRQVGRGVRGTRSDMDQLCGRCINGVAAISALASIGDARACAAVLHRAVQIFDQSNPGEDPDWISYFDAWELAGEAAHCFRDLGQPRETRLFVVQAIDPIHTPARTRAFIDMVGAAGALHAGDLDQAVSLATDAVRSAGSLQSSRYIRYVTDFHKSLTDKSASYPSVREFAELVRVSYPALVVPKIV